MRTRQQHTNAFPLKAHRRPGHSVASVHKHKKCKARNEFNCRQQSNLVNATRVVARARSKRGETLNIAFVIGQRLGKCSENESRSVSRARARNARLPADGLCFPAALIYNVIPPSTNSRGPRILNHPPFPCRTERLGQPVKFIRR